MTNTITKTAATQIKNITKQPSTKDGPRGAGSSVFVFVELQRGQRINETYVPYASYRLNNSAAFVPPKPKLFDSAYSTSAFRGSFGT